MDDNEIFFEIILDDLQDAKNAFFKLCENFLVLKLSLSMTKSFSVFFCVSLIYLQEILIG